MENNKPEEDLEVDETKSLYVYGRNVAEIPCFRNSFLYGAGGGFITGLGTFMATSRPQFSTHIGFGTFFCTTLAYWFHCRYDYSKKKFFYSQLKTAMKKQVLYEGTVVEQEAVKKAEKTTV